MTPDAVTQARSAAGVISIDSPARADTCPYAVTSPSRASTFAASATSSRSPAPSRGPSTAPGPGPDPGITVSFPFPDGQPHI